MPSALQIPENPQPLAHASILTFAKPYSLLLTATSCRKLILVRNKA